MSLTAESILNCNDSGIKKISVPEWGGDVFIRTMSGTERDSWEMYAGHQLEKKGNVNIRAKLAVITLCDESGKRLFADQQLDKLSSKNGKALDRVYSESLKLNKLTDEEVEQLEKN